jgi:hypothetical protein
MQSNFVDSIAEGRCRPTAARNDDSQSAICLCLRVVLSSRTLRLVTTKRYSIESSFDTLGMSMPAQLLYVADQVQVSQRTVMVRVS